MGDSGTTYAEGLVGEDTEGLISTGRPTGKDEDLEFDPDELPKVVDDLGFDTDTTSDITTTIEKSNIDIGAVDGFKGTKQEVVGVEKVPLLKNGKPVVNKKGKPTMKTPSKVGDVKFAGRASGVLKAVAKEFGVDHRKVPTGITLKPNERNAVLDKLSANAGTVLKHLPDHHTRHGKAVGIQQVLLDAFYEEAGYRGGTTGATSVGDVGMDAQGLKKWKKKSGLDVQTFMEGFGIEGFGGPDGDFIENNRYDTKKTSKDSILKAVVAQMATLAANQELRVQAKEKGSHPTDIIAEFGDGKNELSFSKVPI